MVIAVLLMTCSLDMISGAPRDVGDTAAILSEIDPDEGAGKECDKDSCPAPEIKQKEEVPEKVEEEVKEEEAPKEENEVKEEESPKDEEPREEPANEENSHSNAVPVEALVSDEIPEVPKAIPEALRSSDDEIVEKISKNLSAILDEKVLNENTIRRIVREEIEKVFKERDALNEKAASKEPEDEIRLIIYRMEFCPPCDAMYTELMAAGLPMPIYVGHYPTTFRDGTPVSKYPSLELVHGDSTIEKWEGRTPVNTILERYSEYVREHRK